MSIIYEFNNKPQINLVIIITEFDLLYIEYQKDYKVVNVLN